MSAERVLLRTPARSTKHRTDLPYDSPICKHVWNSPGGGKQDTETVGGRKGETNWRPPWTPNSMLKRTLSSKWGHNIETGGTGGSWIRAAVKMGTKKVRYTMPGRRATGHTSARHLFHFSFHVRSSPGVRFPSRMATRGFSDTRGEEPMALGSEGVRAHEGAGAHGGGEE